MNIVNMRPVMWKLHSASSSVYDEQNRRVDKVLETPELDAVVKLLDDLDGARCSEACLTGPNGFVMVVGGGPELFNISVIGNDFGPYELLGPEDLEETVSIVIGGQQVDFPRRFLSQKDAIVAAASYFHQHGKLDPALQWEAC